MKKKVSYNHGRRNYGRHNSTRHDSTGHFTNPGHKCECEKNPKRVAAGKAIAEKRQLAREEQKKK